MREFNQTHCTHAVDISLTDGQLSQAKVVRALRVEAFNLLVAATMLRDFNPTRCTHAVDISLTVQLSKGRPRAAGQQFPHPISCYDEGIQPDPLYACG
jgi:hypothetical protein